MSGVGVFDVLEQGRARAGLPPEAHAFVVSDRPGWEPAEGDEAELVVLGAFSPSQRRPLPSVIRTRSGVTLRVRSQQGGGGPLHDTAVEAWRGHAFCAPTKRQARGGRTLCQTQGVLMVSFPCPRTLCAWVFSKGGYVNGAGRLPKTVEGLQVRVMDGGFLHFVPTDFSGLPCYEDVPSAAPMRSGLRPGPVELVHADGLGLRTRCRPHLLALVVTQFASGRRGQPNGRDSKLWLIAHRPRKSAVLDCAFTGDVIESEGGAVARVVARFGEYLCGPVVTGLKE